MKIISVYNQQLHMDQSGCPGGQVTLLQLVRRQLDRLPPIWGHFIHQVKTRQTGCW